MTAEELISALSQLNLQSLPDDVLKQLRATLSLKKSEADWIIRGRTHLKTHFSSLESNSN